MALGRAYDYTARVMVENMMARDAEEGIEAFLQKREAKWTRRIALAGTPSRARVFSYMFPSGVRHAVSNPASP